jgi:hypothetical protein
MRFAILLFAIGMAVSLQAASLVVVGTTDASSAVIVLDKADPNKILGNFAPYGRFTGGVYVAVGDVNGDSNDDVITGPGPGTLPLINVFAPNGQLLKSFQAYDGGFLGGVRVASADLDNDGAAEIITGAGPGAAGGPVKVFNGAKGGLHASFLAYPGFGGGVFVATGDVNNDGRADIITGAGSGATGGHVKVFDGVTGAQIRSFLAYPGFNGGVRVGAVDINGDGFADIITGAGPGAGPHVKIFDGRTLATLASFFAFDSAYTGGIFVAGGSVLATPGLSAGSIATLRIFNANAETTWLMPWPSYKGGFTVAASPGAWGKLATRSTIKLDETWTK